MFKKILVTGGTGLLGSGIKAVSTEYPDSEFVFFGSGDCDLTKLDATLSFFAVHEPDAIIHTAALAGGIHFSKKYPATMLRDNILLNLNVVEAARILGIKKVVMALSSGMYPEAAPKPLKEEYIHDGVPRDANYSYAFAKRLIEPMNRAYAAEYGLNVIGLVVNGLFGESGNFRYEESVMVAALIRRFHENKNTDDPIVIWGDGSPLREYTYAQDMARAFIWCLEHYDQAQILNIGSTEIHSVKETALMIAEIMEIDTSRIMFDSSKPPGIRIFSTDNSKFVKLSNFQYTPFRMGLENTIGWFVENYHLPGRIRL
jgi:GDP-L-fucose synthase